METNTKRTIASLSEETLIYLLLGRTLLEATFYWNARKKKQTHTHTWLFAQQRQLTAYLQLNLQLNVRVSVTVNSKTRARTSRAGKLTFVLAKITPTTKADRFPE